MLWSGHFTFCVYFSVLTGVNGQALVFDILRNPSAETSNGNCSTLAFCSVNEDTEDDHDIQQVISLIISVAESNQSKPLAGLSFFDSGVRVYGDPSGVSGSGILSLKGGELNVYLQGDAPSCQSDAFSCELQFITTQNKGRAIKIEKRVNVAKEVVEESGSNRQDTNVTKEMKAIISDEVSRINLQLENLTTNVVSLMTSVNKRLLRLEDLLAGDLQTRLDRKLNNIELILNEQLNAKLTTLAETVDNSSESIRNVLTERLDTVQKQEDLFEVKDQFRSTDNSMNASSFKLSSPSSFLCEDLHTNLSTIFDQFQSFLLTFTEEAMGKLLAAEIRLNSSGSHASTRLIMETIVRMSRNLSTTEIKLNEIRTELSSNMNTVRSNISSLRDNLTNKHERFSREIKENITSLDTKVTKRFSELASHKQTLATLDKDIKGKLFNIEINLNDINLVLRNIRYIFGL